VFTGTIDWSLESMIVDLNQLLFSRIHDCRLELITCLLESRIAYWKQRLFTGIIACSLELTIVELNLVHGIELTHWNPRLFNGNIDCILESRIFYGNQSLRCHLTFFK
jgi:hypothetical protein